MWHALVVRMRSSMAYQWLVYRYINRFGLAWDLVGGLHELSAPVVPHMLMHVTCV